MVGLQFLIAIYGGYFGAGIGILMLSGLGLMGLTNIHQMNGLKVGARHRHQRHRGRHLRRRGQSRLALRPGDDGHQLVGGFLAAHYSRQIPGKYVRWFVIAIGFLLASYYFWERYA